jgi:signal transduction histidine kinase
MIAQRRTDPNILWVLAAGFALTILLLIGSGWLSVQAVDAVEMHSEELLARHRVSTQLIDEMQGEVAGLSGVFYALAAGPRPVRRAELMARLDVLEKDVHRTLDEAQNESTSKPWAGAKQAVEGFISEVRGLLSSGAAAPPPSLYRSHEALVGAIAQLVSANYRTAIEQEGLESSEHRLQLSRALALLGIALALSIVCALATVRIAVQMFRRIEWQAKELSRLSGHVLQTQEQILHRFSRELHDEFGQSLTAIEANLAAVPAATPEVSARLEDCTLLVKDLMSNVRELSQLLRPSILDDFGLKPSLQWLTDSFAQRTGIAIEAHLNFEERIESGIETHLYRIAQEALTNVTRHSKATKVEMRLEKHGGVLRLTVSDNGGGMRSKPKAGRGGLGVAGMRERMRVAGGHLDVRSDSRGVTVVAEVALDEAAQQRAEANPSPIGG